ncbi:hypothetical protein ACFWF7_20980 [Nocardia sp. NPDC060256]|uniref:hypothetical protein n=1 Tax=unclassified Nocardia TaxID=2637762 RepID=UPI00365F0240
MRSHVIARIDLDSSRLKPDLEYLAMTPRLEEEYDEFASGYWKNLSLANASGTAEDSAYRDIAGSAITTDHRNAGDELLAAKADMLAGYMIDDRALTERFSINDWAS